MAYDYNVYLLAEKFWDVINEVDYDPMHPSFHSFQDPIKEELLKYAEYVLSGFTNVSRQTL